MTSFVTNLIFRMSSITKPHCNIDNGQRHSDASFLQLLDVQNVCKNMRFSLNKICRKFCQSVQDVGIVIDYEGFVHILIFLCVTNSHWQ